MTVEALLKAPFMRNTELLAGESGLARDISNMIPDTELDPEHWVMAGALILWTGEREESLREFLDRMVLSVPAGVFLLGEENKTAVEEAELAWFEENRLPLLYIDRSGIQYALMRSYVTYANVAQSRIDLRAEMVRELCLYDRSRISMSTAKANGYNPSFYYYVILFRQRKAEQMTPVQRELSLEAVRNSLAPYLQRPYAEVLSFQEGEEQTLLIPTEETCLSNNEREKISASVKKVLSELYLCKWTVAVSGVATSLQGIYEVYQQALHTADIVTALRAFETVSFYDDWYMHMALLNQPREGLEHLMVRTLGPVLDKPELVKTLSTYLTYGESLKLTAEKLYIHVNTLKYRLNQIGDALSCDLANPNVRFRLRVAIIIERYLNGVSDPDGESDLSIAPHTPHDLIGQTDIV